jgi:hypothetical protein
VHRLVLPAQTLLWTALSSLALVSPAGGQTGVVRIKSVNALRSGMRYLAGLAGRGELAQAVEDAVTHAAGPKGREGLDQDRPLGLYLDWPPGWMEKGFTPFQGVAFIPLSDETKFLDLLHRLKCKVAKAGAGMYQVMVPGGRRVFLRIVNGYGYAALEASLLRGKLPDPATLRAGGKNSLLAVRLRVDRIPLRDKRFAARSLVERFFRAAYGGPEKRKDEPAELAKERLAQRKAVEEQFQAYPHLGVQEVTIQVDLDPRKHHLAAEVSVVPTPDSKLAAGLKGLRAERSRFGHLTRDAKWSLFYHYPSFPVNPTPAIVELVEDLQTAVDPKRRALMRRGAKYLGAMQTHNFPDFAVAFHARRRGWTWTAGARIPNGHKLENLLREFVKDLSRGERQLYDVRWNYARHAGTRIHRFGMPLRFGPLKYPGSWYVAIREEEVLVCWGVGAEEASRSKPGDAPGLLAMREALDGLEKPGRPGTPLFRAEGAPAWVAVMVYFFLTDAGDEEARAAWTNLFSLGKVDAGAAAKLGQPLLARLLSTFRAEDLDRLRAQVVLRAGEALRFRVELDTRLLRAVPVVGW